MSLIQKIKPARIVFEIRENLFENPRDLFEVIAGFSDDKFY